MVPFQDHDGKNTLFVGISALVAAYHFDGDGGNAHETVCRHHHTIQLHHRIFQLLELSKAAQGGQESQYDSNK